MVETLEQHIIFFYRSMMLLADKWHGSTLSSLNKESEKLFGAFTQKRFSSHPSRIFNESLKDFSELCSKTKFGKSNQKSSRALTLQKPAAIHRNPYSSSHNIRGVAFKRGQIYKKHDGFFSKSWSLRYAVLDNTALYYFKDEKESSGLKQTIDLKGGRLENYQDEERKPAFKVTDNAGNSYIFSGTNQFDNDEWKGLMEKAADIKQEKVEPLPGAAGQPARFIQKDSHLPITKVNEAKSFLGEIAMSNLGLVSVVNGVRVFGPINNELQHELTLSRNRHFEFIQIELLFDFLRTKSNVHFNHRE